MKSKRTPAKHLKNYKTQADKKLDTALKSSFLGVLFTAGISLALLFASTAAALMTDDPTSLVDFIGYASIFVSAFFGGFVCSKLDKTSPYLVGILTGAGFVIISILFSLVLPHSLASGMKILPRIGLHVLSFALFPIGTFIGVKSSKPKHKNKNHKRR